MKHVKKILLAVMAVLMVMTAAGCVDKIEKLDKDVRKALETKDYRAAADLYEKAINDGLDKEVVIPKVVEFYKGWLKDKTYDTDASIMDLLVIMEELRDRFPDAKDEAEKTLAGLCAALVTGSEDLDKADNLYKAFMDRYADSEKITGDVRAVYEVYLAGIIQGELNTLKDSTDLLACIESQDYEGIIKAIESTDLESKTQKIYKKISLPVHVDVADNKVLAANWESGCLTVYYGALDTNNRKTGSGVFYTHIVDGNNYVKEVTYCDFTNDKRNGNFKQFLEKRVNKLDKMVSEGVLVDNKFNGRVKSTMTRDGETIYLTFNFEDGMVKVIDTSNSSGATVYYVADGTGPGGSLYYTKGEKYTQNPHGMAPYYSSLN
ncbi:MAG: hypothetical protein IIY33_04690 [Erysipelotrichaceae bacterium]|nr:hypothetical protein [Erysipelotrichaceae bacterium]